MNPNNIEKPRKSIDGWMISTIVLSVLSIALIALAVLLYINYNEQKTDVDTKIRNAESSARNDQSKIELEKFTLREKDPNREFVGPDDYGRVTFNYPKTWSLFINEDANNGGTFEAYLNPISVPPISSTQQYALRVLIEEKDYDKTVSGYDSLVKKGDLKSSSVSAGGKTGTRLDGNFNKDIRGAAVIFKINDNTLTIRTDANTFLTDFDKLVTTIKFNQ